MKTVVSQVTQMYPGGTGASYDTYSFTTPGGSAIPMYAKVTVEWNDDEHRCEKSERAHLRIKKGDSNWFVWEEGKLATGSVSGISCCPCCGKELEGG